jgi:hypothetical protein
MAAVHRAIVDERHRQRQAVIARLVDTRLEALLVTMRDLGEDELVRYVDSAYPAVAGGQRVSADTAAAYAEVLAGRRRARRPLDVEGALRKSGVLVGPDTRSVVAPVLRARHLVAEGESQPAALRTAASYAGQLSAADLQAAMRVGVDEGAKASGLEVGGWRKAPGGDACDWCQTIADNVYDDADAVPFHDGDKCGVEPDLEGPPERTFDDSDIPF